MSDDFMRFLAAWALVHETADEGWKAAVERGADVEPGEMNSGPDAFVDGLSAMVAKEKERLKQQLAAGPGNVTPMKDKGADLERLSFELGEIRGRLEAIETQLDALARRLGPES